MNDRSRPKAAPESPATATTDIVDQGELLTVRRQAYGSVVFDDPAPVSDETPGPVRRDVGHRRVAQAHGGEPWLGLAQAWIVAAAGRGRVFTAEDVRAAVGEPPSANLLGVVLRRCRLRGVIRVVGVTYASRPEAHHRLLQQWGAR